MTNHKGTNRMSAGLITTPFTVLVDNMEQHAFQFLGLHCDSAKNNRELLVKTRYEHLGAGQGDYQLEEYRGLASVERKSAEDLYGTLLGWKGGRRERFQRELDTLSQMELGAIVVESSLGDVIKNAPSWGKRTARQNSKSLYRTYISWSQKWRNVQWYFCDSRQLAEITCFRLLEKFYERKREEEAHAQQLNGTPINTNTPERNLNHGHVSSTH